MEKKGILADIVKSKWLVVAASVLMMCFSGPTHIFGIFSGSIRDALEYNQETLQTLSFFADLGTHVGIPAALLYEVAPPSIVICLGAIMNFFGYLMMWLAVTDRIERPPVWNMYLYMFIGSNSQNFVSTTAMVTCLKIFPKSRGSVIELLRGLTGLSGAIFIQIYYGVDGKKSSILLLLIACLPTIVSLLLMFVIRPMNVSTEKTEPIKFSAFMTIALILASYLAVLTVFENIIVFPRLANRILAATTAVILLLNLAPVVQAELLKRHSAADQGSSPVHIMHSSPMFVIRGEKQKIEENQAVTITLPCSKQMCEEEEDDKLGTRKGDEMTLWRALMSLDLWVLFLASTFGMGATLTGINNMGQIGESLGYSKAATSTYVSLLSVWIFLGCVISGRLTTILQQKYRIPRSLMLTFVLLTATVGHLFVALNLPGALWMASTLTGLCLGAQWPVVPCFLLETYGLKHFTALFGLTELAGPLGSYLMSVRVAGYLYDEEVKRQFKALEEPSADAVCYGVYCFRLAFILMAIFSLIGALISVLLVVRTRNTCRGSNEESCDHKNPL